VQHVESYPLLTISHTREDNY